MPVSHFTQSKIRQKFGCLFSKEEHVIIKFKNNSNESDDILKMSLQFRGLSSTAVSPLDQFPAMAANPNHYIYKANKLVEKPFAVVLHSWKPWHSII